MNEWKNMHEEKAQPPEPPEKHSDSIDPMWLYCCHCGRRIGRHGVLPGGTVMKNDSMVGHICASCIELLGSAGQATRIDARDARETANAARRQTKE